MVYNVWVLICFSNFVTQSCATQSSQCNPPNAPYFLKRKRRLYTGGPELFLASVRL
jgi:hypothetical protein